MATPASFGADNYVVPKYERQQALVGKASGTTDINELKNFIQSQLGKGIIVEPGAYNVDSYYSAIDSRHGLHFTIRGRADQVMLNIATHLVQSSDPINLIMNKSVHKSYKVHVTRYELIGGEMEEIPERAPARVVSSREIKREIELCRYGNDVEVDTNLFADPPLAQADISRKVDFQKLQFEKKLIQLGYKALMDDSTDLITAYSRTVPDQSFAERYHKAFKRYKDVCLFAFNAGPQFTAGQTGVQINNNPLPSILAMVRHAATATATPPNAMIIPASIDINGFSRNKDASFMVTGIAANATPTNFPLANVFTDPMTNLSIGVHYPLMDYSQSSRHPRALSESGLSEKLYIRVDVSGGTDLFFEAITSSAIIGSQGAGELMIAYPQSTAHTVEVAPEVMRMQMRAYLGAAVLQQENVIRIPHVFCDHIKPIKASDVPGAKWPDDDAFDIGGDDFAHMTLSYQEVQSHPQLRELLKDYLASGEPSAAIGGEGPTTAPSQGGGSTLAARSGMAGKYSTPTKGGASKPVESETVDLSEQMQILEPIVETEMPSTKTSETTKKKKKLGAFK